MKRRQGQAGSLTLGDPGTLRALASPHRLETIAALGDAGQASIAELARRLGRTPHSLYYHVKCLAEAGVIVLAETRRRGRRDEQVWTLAAERILLDPMLREAGSGIAASKAIDAMLRLTSRELRAAVQRERGQLGEPRPLVGLRMKGRFDRPTLDRIQRLVGELERLVQKANQRDVAGDPYALTVVLAPTGRRTRGST